METFARYGFNKSHSAAYALVSYQTAYLKTHYPVEFMAALMTSEMGDTDKVIKNLAECREKGIEVLAPDINESRSDFTPVGDKIRFGLAAVKNVGEKAVEVILESRDRRRPFRIVVRFLPAGRYDGGEPAGDREPDQVRRLRFDPSFAGAHVRRAWTTP